MSSPQKRRQREQLFAEQGGRCYWCGVPMTMPVHVDNKAHPPTTATIEHLFSRLSPDRGRIRGRTHVLACLACNNKRAKLEEKALPRETLWRLSGSRPYRLGWTVWNNDTVEPSA